MLVRIMAWDCSVCIARNTFCCHVGSRAELRKATGWATHLKSKSSMDTEPSRVSSPGQRTSDQRTSEAAVDHTYDAPRRVSNPPQRPSGAAALFPPTRALVASPCTAGLFPLRLPLLLLAFEHQLVVTDHLADGLPDHPCNFACNSCHTGLDRGEN